VFMGVNSIISRGFLLMSSCDCVVCGV